MTETIEPLSQLIICPLRWLTRSGQAKNEIRTCQFFDVDMRSGVNVVFCITSLVNSWVEMSDTISPQLWWCYCVLPQSEVLLFLPFNILLNCLIELPSRHIGTIANSRTYGVISCNICLKVPQIPLLLLYCISLIFRVRNKGSLSPLMEGVPNANTIVLLINYI